MGSEYHQRIIKRQKSPAQNTIKGSHVPNRSITNTPMQHLCKPPITDNRTEILRQSNIIEKLRASPRAHQAAQIKSMVDNSPYQLKQRQFSSIIHPIQNHEYSPLQNQKILQKKVNKTGMPDNLKNGLENLSGMSMDHVKVHYNSPEPAKLTAHAFTQGSDIHVAPSQEKHLPHEGWHVVQQAQGRVQPTIQMAGTQINDDVSLETEADVMGGKAASVGPQTVQRVESGDIKENRPLSSHHNLEYLRETKNVGNLVTQRVLNQDVETELYVHNGGANRYRKVVNGGNTYYMQVDTGIYHTYNAPADTLHEVPAPAHAAAPVGNTIDVINPGRLIGTFNAAPAVPDAGYVANIPATHGDAPLVNIPIAYLNGFADMAEARSKFGMVIGINGYDYQGQPAVEPQLDPNIYGTLNADIGALAGAWNALSYPVAIFGFVWRSPAVRHRLNQNQLARAAHIPVPHAQPISQDVIPYGEIRDEIALHPYTKHLVKELNNTLNIQNVFIHTADADARNLNVSGGRRRHDDDRLRLQENSRLYAAMDAKVHGYLNPHANNQHPPQLPDVISGGYDFRVPGGATAANTEVRNALLAFASRLDLTVRDAMANIDERLVYFPEPNTFIRVLTNLGHYTLEHGTSFGQGRNEGQQLMDSLRDNHMRFGATTEFDPKLALETEGARFRAAVSADVNMINVGNITAAQIGGLFNLAQSHARRQTWSDRVDSRIIAEFGVHQAGAWWQGLYNVAFSSAAHNNDPASILRDSNAGINTSVDRYMDDFPTATHNDRQAKQKTSSIAKASGKAVLTFLKHLIVEWNRNFPNN